jgi:flavin-dependent dehydrogenase
MMDWDIVIVGAGLAGSSLATALAREGWKVLLLEQGDFPRHKVCGEFLSPESQASLRALGLDQAVAALDPSHIPDARMCGRNGQQLRMALPGTALGVSRYVLDAALADAARGAGAEVRTHASATNVERVGDGFEVEVRVTNERSKLRTRAVVLACGRHPPRALRPAAPSAPPEHTWVGIKGHFTGVTMPAAVEIYLFRGGYVGVSPVEGGRVNACALVTRNAFAVHKGGAERALRAIIRTHPQLERRLAGGTLLTDTITAVAAVDTERPSIPWDGFARIGDAATMIPPLCGDGQAMALRSAEICAPLAHDFLRGHRSLAEWEQAYRTVWHAEFDRRLRVGRQMQWLLGKPGLSDLLLRAGTFVPGVVACIVRATRGHTQPLAGLHGP